MAKGHCIDRILDNRGIKATWLAAQLGISDSYMSKLLAEERGWTDALKREAGRVLMLPVDLLFFAPDLSCNTKESESEVEAAHD